MINPVPPELPGITWRAIGMDDLSALHELASTCHSADGGLGWMFELDDLKRRYFPDPPGAVIGAFSPDERLVACASVYLREDADTQRAIFVGQVQAEFRKRGIGTYLMRWCQMQAQRLLPDTSPSQKLVLQVATESLTEPAHRLYIAHGFEPVFEELVMRRDLHLPLPDRPLPPGVVIENWQPGLAEQFYQAYFASFHDRPGFPGWSSAEWISMVAENDHIPEWSLLALEDSLPLGFVIGNTDLTTDPPGGFVWQIGVTPTQRRRGIGSALLVETMRRMQAAGAIKAELTVHVNNPGAIQAYTRLGFVTIGRRARYERTAGP